MDSGQFRKLPRGYFDTRDFDLLNIVNDVLSRKDYPSLKKLLSSYLHPHGIKEMAATKGLRVAYAVVHLLGSLETGRTEDRLDALRTLRDEVLTTATSSLRRNTARVLLQIMKELVRGRGDHVAQLKLARDFRSAATGKPRVIHAQLRKYHLIEMPEEWNQVAFDDHVHDANTKGRKSATHLIMDAWIKGIRRLTVIYYNYVTKEVAEELLEAAAIMGMNVRIGIEFSPRFRGRYLKLILASRENTDTQEYLRFLADPQVAAFMAEGQKVSQYHQRYVMRVFESFNSSHRLALNERFGIQLDPLEKDDFLASIGTGQASLLHLGKFIHDALTPLLAERAQRLSAYCALPDSEERRGLDDLVRDMNELTPESLIETYLEPGRNPDLPDPNVPDDGPDVPWLLTLGPAELAEGLTQLHAGFRIVLSLSRLRAEDVLEILYGCQGRVTHLEVFNLKDCALGKAVDNERILELQAAINSQNVVRLKRFIQGVIAKTETSAAADAAERVRVLERILCDIPGFQSYYKYTPLKSRVGTDSTGQSHRLHGMGYVIRETLPVRGQKALDSIQSTRRRIPVRAKAFLRETFRPREGGGFTRRGLGLLGRLPGGRRLFTRVARDWVVQDYAASRPEESNIYTLGGVQKDPPKAYSPCEPRESHRAIPLRYLNSWLKNSLKILLGFVPACLTFLLSKDWWLLAYGGAFIWFAITGVRNVIQSVLGSGGFRRSPLLRWRDYVSWERVADSLLYTGFSVPLLDWLVKTVILDRGLSINTTTSPLGLYAFMALANGLYLMSHNLFRGLPRAAAVANLFRSVLSIPVALALNDVLGVVLGWVGVVGVNAILQQWAAIISKLASDTVAAVIEGLADRGQNMRMRRWDYTGKIEQIFKVYARLEMLFPRQDVLRMLESPREFLSTIASEGRDFDKIVAVNALDLLYFWWYQPRAKSVLKRCLREMTQEERKVFILSQYVLLEAKEISQLFLDGLVGKDFSKALAFYLDYSRKYLEELQELALGSAPQGTAGTVNGAGLVASPCAEPQGR
ncbi:hypothetical protein [Desulfovibrio aminophilus]|uniref:hypothetical protein n=1 Tax=Desulfovibrio aminophilus TaxID=81425 RepID=UPI001B7F9FD7|nr:hypothetical protein [Desulfovibrio aminophilus]